MFLFMVGHIFLTLLAYDPFSSYRITKPSKTLPLIIANRPIIPYGQRGAVLCREYELPTPLPNIEYYVRSSKIESDTLIVSTQ